MLDIQPALVTAGSRNLSEFIGFLTMHPSLDEVCRRLVAEWPVAGAIDQAAIGLLGNDGRITFPGRFGYEYKVAEGNARSTIWDQLPCSLAMLNQRVVVVTEQSDIHDQFPQLAKAMPDISSVLAAPLISKSTSYGVCVVSGTDPLRHVQESVAIFTENCLALSLYVHSWRGNYPGGESLGTNTNTAQSVPTDSPRRHTLVPNVLSDRQLTVLHYLAEGHSNRQIGRLMGFSESTIRQATTAIYAFFGVSGRREAVQAAILRNMVEMTSAETPSAAGIAIEERSGVNPHAP
jgi:DNA-binding CsgD family transcriptional regulator